MPFTLYHFGPHASVALPLHRYLDIPIFIGANVVVDFEPLLVMTFNLDYPLHGYCHTLLIGSLVGLAWATAAFPLRHFIGKIMSFLRLPYASSFAKMAISGVAGVWLHVLFDAPIYYDIQPFYPIKANPLFGSLSLNAGYDISAACFVPAILMYVFYAFVRKGRGIGVRP
jgi:membrane-bound metal-dependent hydrolase YbcI (DUF457 family)